MSAFSEKSKCAHGNTEKRWPPSGWYQVGPKTNANGAVRLKRVLHERQDLARIIEVLEGVKRNDHIGLVLRTLGELPNF